MTRTITWPTATRSCCGRARAGHPGHAARGRAGRDRHLPRREPGRDGAPGADPGLAPAEVRGPGRGHPGRLCPRAARRVAAHGDAAHAGPPQRAGRPGTGTAQPRVAARACGVAVTSARARPRGARAGTGLVPGPGRVTLAWPRLPAAAEVAIVAVGYA